AILRAILRMSQALGLRTLAEGVESAEEAEMLRQEGCEAAQGFFFSRPVSGVQLGKQLSIQQQLRTLSLDRDAYGSKETS
ncbi:EAL domain-containing protein, partial [Roseomonas sp. SSH11]